MKTTILFFDRLMQKWTPDPYIIAVFLTLVVITLAKIFTPASSSDIILSWGDGIWKLSTFTLQMAMILIGGYLVASAPLTSRFLKKICSYVHSPSGAIVITTFISGFASWLNWGFGLVIGAFLAVEMARAVPHTNFRILVASSYSGFLLWHGGLSGSIPLVVNTEGNFSFEWIGRVIPLSETIFSPFNLIAVIGLFFILPLTNLLLAKMLSSQVETTNLFDLTANHNPFENTKLNTPAEKIEHSPIVPLAFFVLGASYIMLTISKKQFRLDLNSMNFLFLILGVLLQWRSWRFLSALKEASKKVGPILIQYPIYAGIMGVMRETGLANVISDFFVNTSTPITFPLFTFWGAGILNFFIPSGGGQWAVQAPVVIPAAEALGVHVPLSIMAVAWGDAWTNLAQPFWALPVLAIAGLSAKDILGFTLAILVVSGLYLSILFLIFS